MLEIINSIDLASIATLPTQIAEVSGDIGKGLTAAFGCAAAAIGVGMVGTKAVEAVGRNPGASGKVLVQSILGMALAEAVAFYSLFLY
ncbi:ATP synthase F0 subunit C [Rubellicoccus peritrichatus]|uniref:ATP synthase F(0) sector subunit c n=1 Tax=Rubellicoccus peritrichatus TaxID=3080537 RepID=A0AAQ3QSD0_9BACT|nr:ATP synthase F0 subunit C [Puniceicoccus sp. CR14]WOO42278.1 ATP synthase F0 subunit C [Puniceicoccus sp. CR14]